MVPTLPLQQAVQQMAQQTVQLAGLQMVQPVAQQAVQQVGLLMGQPVELQMDLQAALPVVVQLWDLQPWALPVEPPVDIN
jgi:hypothetical protein